MVTRPGYSDRDRAGVLALMAYEGRCCPHCRTYDSLVELGPSGRHVALPDGREFGVTLYRCHVCGLEETVRRSWHEQHKDDEPNHAGAKASDGLIFIPRPFEEAADDG